MYIACSAEIYRVEKRAEKTRRRSARVDGQIGEPNDQGVKANEGVDGPRLLHYYCTAAIKLAPYYRCSIRQPCQRGCSYKEFLACNPKEYDWKGGAIVYTRWIEKMESVQDMSRCGDD
ncbi:hypothetical protein Tco_0132473 [Tanacetum coccineum]